MEWSFCALHFDRSRAPRPRGTKASDWSPALCVGVSSPSLPDCPQSDKKCDARHDGDRRNRPDRIGLARAKRRRADGDWHRRERDQDADPADPLIGAFVQRVFVDPLAGDDRAAGLDVDAAIDTEFRAADQRLLATGTFGPADGGTGPRRRQQPPTAGAAAADLGPLITAAGPSPPGRKSLNDLPWARGVAAAGVATASRSSSSSAGAGEKCVNFSSNSPTPITSSSCSSSSVTRLAVDEKSVGAFVVNDFPFRRPKIDSRCSLQCARAKPSSR